MQTTFITSHGSHCISGNGATVFKLPSNVIVLMNCDNALTWTDEYFESKFWSFATNSKLHLAMGKTKVDVNTLGKYLTEVEKFNGKVVDETNNFCVFTDKCPDLLLTYEAKTFRSGIFTLPVKITVKGIDDKFNDTQLTSAMFQSFAEKDKSLSKRIKRLIRAWVKYGQKGKLTSDEFFSVRNRHDFPSKDYVDNMLSKIVKDVVEKEPNKMHFVIVSACRDRQQVNMKIQQYSLTDNPYQATIVVYEKIRKLQEQQK